MSTILAGSTRPLTADVRGEFHKKILDIDGEIRESEEKNNKNLFTFSESREEFIKVTFVNF